MKMAQTEQEDKTRSPTEEIIEEQFLKNLYLFMKKRDTPIERIPNLGFKQIDLFMMFKTVSDLGGYHQVTSHQLWKRVYNTLGGNPRSTSAATCTRRHYEKLLLAYECHLKGILMNTMSHHQTRSYNYAIDKDGSKRLPKQIQLPLGCFQSDQLGNIYSLPLQYHPFYHPAHPVLPPYVSISSSVIPQHVPPAPKVPRLSFQSIPRNLVNMVGDPLQHLRELAEQYKSSTGLLPSEPLNLSVKASAQESDTSPVSSFSPPSSSKNPKFLNKPSTLYTPHHAGVVKNEGDETQDGESSDGVSTLSESENKNKADDGNVQARTQSDSPIFISALTPKQDKDIFETIPKPNTLKADFPVHPAEYREVRTEVESLNLSHVMQRIPKDKEGKMEIEVPLSVVRNWLKLYGSSAKLAEADKLLISDYDNSSGKTRLSDVELFQTDLTLRSPQHQSSAEDLRLTNKSSPKPSSDANFHQDGCFTSGQTADGLLRKEKAGQNIWPLERQDLVKSSRVKSAGFWDTYSDEATSPRSPVKPNSSPPRKRAMASKFYMEDIMQLGKQRLEVEPSAVLMVNSSPASVFPLSTEEMVKLQTII